MYKINKYAMDPNMLIQSNYLIATALKNKNK